jgi:predicted nucleic acid-binding protein
MQGDMTASKEMFLLDTNLIVYWINHELGCLKSKPEADAAKWCRSKIMGRKAILSFATVAELKRWVISTEDAEDTDRIGGAVNGLIERSHMILGNQHIADSWAMIANEAKKRGKMKEPKPLSTQINDIWIAAIAHASQLTLLTCDTGFNWMKIIGVSVLVFRNEEQSLEFEEQNISQ